MEAEETEADVNWFNATPSNSSVVNSNELGMEEADSQLAGPAPDTRVPFDKFDMYYNMTGDKYLYIFNHYQFEANEYYGSKEDAEKLTRHGTHKDVTSLEVTFGNLGFQTKVHNDLCYDDVLKEMREVCSMDHSATSCVAVAVMTHGHNGGVLLAADKPYRFSELTDIMQKGHPSLVGKPKLFFIQACRSGHMDSGRTVLGENVLLPTQSDTLVVCSSSPHYYSYRCRFSGSWLMQSLCEVLEQHHEFFDLNQMLAFVNQAVAYKCTVNHLEPDKANKKQMPETKHTFTKLLKL